MEEDKFYKGIENLKSKGLTTSEKRLLLSRLEKYIDGTNSWKSDFSWYTFLYTKQFYYATFSFLILLGGAGLISASKNSLPGEFLYPLKINITEPLQGVSMLGTQSKVDWEVKKVENRLEEVEVLAAQGKLNSSINEEIQTTIQKQTDSFNQVVKDESAKGNVENATFAQVDLGAKLGAHDRILQKLEDHSDQNQKTEIVKLRGKMMKDAGTFSAKIQKNTSLSTSTFAEKEKNIESLINTTENNLKNNRKKVATSTLQDDILGDTETDLSGAKEDLKSARNKINSGNIDEASQTLEDSRIKAENADIFLRQGIRLGRENNYYNNQRSDWSDSNSD